MCVSGPISQLDEGKDSRKGPTVSVDLPTGQTLLQVLIVGTQLDEKSRHYFFSYYGPSNTKFATSYSSEFRNAVSPGRLILSVIKKVGISAVGYFDYNDS